MRVSIATFVLLAACPGTDTDTDTDTDIGTDTDLDTDHWAALSGTVVDEAGQPIADMRVNLCLTQCTTVSTGSDGGYAFPPLPPATYSLHLEPAEAAGLSEPHVPLTLASDTTPTLDIVVPTLPTPTPLPTTRAEVELGDGLFVTVQQGDLTILFEDDPTEVSGVRVDEADRLPVELPGTVLAMWYPHPWGADADPALPVRITDSWASPNGTPYELWQASYDDAAWFKVGDFVATDGWLVDDDARLHKLETLILVAPGQR